jgi:hypothetical protein
MRSQIVNSGVLVLPLKSSRRGRTPAVESGGSFVENENGRIFQEHPCQCQALALPRRQVGAALSHLSTIGAGHLSSLARNLPLPFGDPRAPLLTVRTVATARSTLFGDRAMIRPTQALCAFALALLLTCTGYASAEETKGTIKSVDTGKHEVVLSGTIRNTIYELNKDGFVCLDGVKSKLADLREGDHAVIVYDKQGEHFMASEIRGLRNAKEATGTVRGTFGEKREITIKGVVKDTTYELDTNATVLAQRQQGNARRHPRRGPCPDHVSA